MTDKIVSINGGTPIDETTIPAETPKPRSFLINTDLGEFELNGYMLLAPAFVAIGNADGEVEFVVPMDKLNYAGVVQETEGVSVDPQVSE